MLRMLSAHLNGKTGLTKGALFRRHAVLTAQRTSYSICLPQYAHPLDVITKLIHLQARVETLMCYLGIGDTYTPCHKDLCASSGQNLMCYTENNASAFWFMTQSCSAPAVAKYFHTLKQDLDLESYTITVAEMAKAPFDVYIAEQKLGDFVLVPPRSCHQVVNSGGLTIKMSWSRMTIKGAKTALYHELPIYRRQVGQYGHFDFCSFKYQRLSNGDVPSQVQHSSCASTSR